MSVIKLGSLSFDFNLTKKEDENTLPTLDASLNINASVTKPLVDTLSTWLAIGPGKSGGFLLPNMFLDSAKNLLSDKKGVQNGK